MLEARNWNGPLKRGGTLNLQTLHLDPAKMEEAIRRAHRVAVIGCCGSGKSYFAARLAEGLKLPLVRLDDLYWREGWTRPCPERWPQVVHQAALMPRWIIDGNYLSTLEMRLGRANLAFFLDIRASICLARVVLRDARRCLGDTSTLPLRVKNTERFSRRVPRHAIRFWREVFLFGQNVRPQILSLIENRRTPMVIVKSRAAVSELLELLS